MAKHVCRSFRRLVLTVPPHCTLFVTTHVTHFTIIAPTTPILTHRAAHSHTHSLTLTVSPSSVRLSLAGTSLDDCGKALALLRRNNHCISSDRGEKFVSIVSPAGLDPPRCTVRTHCTQIAPTTPTLPLFVPITPWFALVVCRALFLARLSRVGLQGRRAVQRPHRGISYRPKRRAIHVNRCTPQAQPQASTTLFH